MRPLRKMLVVANTDWFVANYMAAFLLAHRRAGIEVVVGSPHGAYADVLTQAGLDWREVPISRGRGSLVRDLAAVKAMARLEREVRPDLVHRVTAKPVILGLMLRSRRPGTGIINALPGLGYASANGGAGARFDQWVQRWGVRSAARRASSRTVLQNKADLAAVLGSGTLSRRVGRLIPGWGVDLDRFSRPRHEAVPPLVLMVSRMLWAKGVGEFVEAASLCRAQANIRFALVGDSDPGNPTHVPVSQLEAWRTEGTVEWWGHRNDIPDLLASASLVVLPTRYGEGVPQSLIEAAAAGVPAVASDLPGCREIIVHGVNGYLVPPRDIQSLTQAIARVVADDDLRAKMGASGRTIARERFILDRVLPQYAEVYRELGLETELGMTTSNGH